MAVFGEHNYGTPFGALKTSEFFTPDGYGYYDYSGYSTRGFSGYSVFSGFSGYSGYSGYSSFCGASGLEFIPLRPTLTFPSNFSLLSGDVTITWRPANPIDACLDTVTYEIQFTRTLSQQAGWKTLSIGIPSSTNSLSWDISNIPYSEDCGLRIRAKDSKGLYSEWYTSPIAFTIANHAPNPVIIVNPLPRDEFDSFIPITWEEAEIKDIDGQSVVYAIEVTDNYAADDNWLDVPNASTLPEGTTAFSVICKDYPEGDNYGIRISSIDSLGLGSVPTKIGPLTIKHSGQFYIDTIPPEGTMILNNGDPLAMGTTIKIQLNAHDIGTDIKDIRFKNEDGNWSEWDSFANEKFWDLDESDGVKRIFVQFRDYGGNISEVCDCEIVSRVLCDEGNITDIEVFNNKLYAAFDANGNLIEYRVLKQTAETFTEDALTALAKVGSSLFVATYSGTNSYVYQFSGVNATSTRRISLSGSTTKIDTMVSFDDNLYIGCNDGKIIKYDVTLQTNSTVHTAGSAISRLKSDGSKLYATVSNGGSFLLSSDGITWVTKTI